MHCPQCGQENPESARFCNACAAPLEERAPERRKLATMLFCDLSGSTAMGERLDAESVRDLMFAYFHEMRGAIEGHGGTVEKFIGDAVMAVFGVPRAHEDDALRAVRAAWEMRQRLERLNDDFERRFGSRIALRIGVNTGEVVAADSGTRQALVSGDAVNVAARLEQTASADEILIGETTFRLVRDAVAVEPVAPLSLKGKSEPLPAYRVTHVEEVAPARARQLDTPIVGRTAELALLREKLAEAQSGKTQLVTVVGEPGVGKSRLAAELVAISQEDFRFLSGRCLEYGDGITYWALAEIVRQAAGIRDEHSREEALSRVADIVPAEAASVIGQAIGLAEGQASTAEITAAVCELIDRLVEERPLLVLVDDIHWAEQTLLELLSAIPTAVDGPLLVLCMARPDLLDEHSAWEVTVRLQPLGGDESAALAEQLVGQAVLPDELGQRISAAAAGNPLFVEELVGMLVDEGLLERHDGRRRSDPSLAQLTIPTTLRELLGARLDRMASGERAVLERGSVEGQLFHTGAVLELSEDLEPDHARELLQALVGREYIHPERADFVDESAFRVRHVLIRDAAYDGIPKKIRTTLHERFADWLERKAGDRVAEFDEVLGYHLEQAYRLREELGPVADVERGLALRAAKHLGAAARRARARRDAGAAVSLLLRTAELRPPGDPTRLEFLESGGHLVLDAGEIERAESIFSGARDEARAAGSAVRSARLEIYATWTRVMLDPGHGAASMLEVADRLEPAINEAGDYRSLAKLHDMRAYVYDLHRRAGDVEREAEIAIGYARQAGDRFLEMELHWWLFWQLPQGPRPLEEAIRRGEQLREVIAGDEAAEAACAGSIALLEAMRGRFSEARALAERSIELWDGLGLHILTAKYALPGLAMIELAAGEPASAERVLVRAIDDTRRSRDPESELNAVSLLAEVRFLQGRRSDAELLLKTVEEAVVGDAVAPQVRWHCARARAQSLGSHHSFATDAARKAQALTEHTDDLCLQGQARLRLAEVLDSAGEQEEAVRYAEEALALYERKGDVVSAAAVRRFLD